MAQLSRPYQAALVLVAVLALAWFAVLRAHVSTSTGGSSSPTSSSSLSTSTSPKAGEIGHDEGKATPVYHGAVPGLSGLSKDIRRAHETVGASETEAHKVEGTAAKPSQATGSVTATPVAKVSHPAAPSHPVAKAQHSSDARAASVESQLHAGKIVLLLFWNAHSTDDQAVHSQVQAVRGSLKGKVALDFAKAREVGSFGTITRDISVLQTPTLLIINRKGLTTTITGLTDSFSIEQAVREAGG
ncbi:MAG: hypothetical protein WB698_02695 [Solirubrobacteraceae bacterium]